jgi:hypothetical protein
MRMTKMSRLIVAALVLAVCVGCVSSQKVPTLDQRSVISLEIVVETDPPKARVFGEDLRCMGEAPVTKKWEVEKLTWSDGATHFRLLPKGTRIRVGEKLSAGLVARIDGYQDEFKTVSVEFSGKDEAVTEKIVLKKAQRAPR